MNLSKINKFSDFVSTNNYIIYSNDFKLKLKTIQPPNKQIFEPNRNEIVIELGKSIAIIYNKITTKITCIFYSEPEYIQSEYILTKPTKFLTPYIKYMVSTVTNPSNCLIIGLCLGNMPNGLIGTFGNKINRIDCIEINSLLCKFYKKYLCISDQIHVYSSSGMDFVKTTKKSYSFVSIDIPCKYITKKFMNLIDIITSKFKDRIIVLNIIGEECNINSIKKSISHFKNITFKKISSNIICILN